MRKISRIRYPSLLLQLAHQILTITGIGKRNKKNNFKHLKFKTMSVTHTHTHEKLITFSNESNGSGHNYFLHFEVKIVRNTS